jgi:hypothetical protein
MNLKQRVIFASEKVELVVSVFSNVELSVRCISYSSAKEQDRDVDPGLNEILNQVVCVPFAQSLKFLGSCK